jgi:4-amino-4-deoxy-L-arabinose transferase-like glycosyltransferase
MAEANAQHRLLFGSNRVLWPFMAIVKPHSALLGLLAGGLLLRLVLLASASSMPLQIVDEQQYAQLATNLLHVREFAFTSGELTSMRPPLYPALVAALWKVGGTEDPQVVRAAQIVFSLLLVAATYLLALRLFNRRTAIAAAAIVCFYPSLLYAGLLVLTEIVFTVLVLVFVLLFVLLLQRPKALWAVLMGATLGLAALTRSVLWPFPVVFLPMLLLTVPGTAGTRAKVAVCCLLGFVAVVGPWSVRNTRLQQTFTVVDTMGGMNLRMGNYEYTPEDRMWDAVNLTGDKSWSYLLGQTRPDALELTVGQKDKWAQHEAIAYMLANPGTTVRRSLLKFADFWGLEREMVAALQQGLYAPPRWFAVVAIVAVVLTYPIVACGAAIGIFRAPPADRRVHVLILAIILFITAVHSVVFGHSRYHLPLVPFLAIYAATAWSSKSWRDLAISFRVAAGPAFLIAALLAAWSHEVLFRDADHIRMLLQALS